MKIQSTLLAGLALTLTTGLASAYISSKAPSASHAMEEGATALHDYMHHAGYASSYGTHDLETESTELHGALHDWDHGEASECEVKAERKDVGAAVLDTGSQFLQNGVFADSMATDLYFDSVGDYLKVWWYTLFAKC